MSNKNLYNFLRALGKVKYSLWSLFKCNFFIIALGVVIQEQDNIKDNKHVDKGIHLFFNYYDTELELSKQEIRSVITFWSRMMKLIWKLDKTPGVIH